MVWYESARLMHGRQAPLLGASYDNLFVHYMPAGLWYREEPHVEGAALPPISAQVSRILHYFHL